MMKRLKYFMQGGGFFVLVALGGPVIIGLISLVRDFLNRKKNNSRDVILNYSNYRDTILNNSYLKRK